jgi:hypothetical protein
MFKHNRMYYLNTSWKHITVCSERRHFPYSTVTHLCLSEVQGGRELCPLCDAQVLLFPELLLQRQQLLSCERCPWLPVRFVFP